MSDTSSLVQTPRSKPVDPTTQHLVVEQVLAGPMGNCLYILGNRETRKALLVDPAWDPLGLVDLAEKRGFEVSGVLATHVHQDHVGGELFGQRIPGVHELLRSRDLPLHIHEVEADRLVEQTGIDASSVRPFASDAILSLGAIEIRSLFVPGHSPGCSAFLAQGHLIAGDTLFVQGCGRVDLPGSDPDAMFHSLRRLAALPPETRVYPGHNYGPAPTSTIGEELERNVYLRVETLEQWRMLMA